MENKVSLVIPVYNSKEYLKRCIDSIIYQTYSHWELILVDDASSDGSGELCKQYAVKDARIKVIQKKFRGGVSSARNTGMKYTSGQYLLFVDSDDYLEPEALEVLINKALENDYDVVMFGNNKVYDNGVINSSTRYHLESPIMNREQAIENTYIYGGMLWNKFVKVSLIKDNNIIFDEELKASEDWLVSLQLFTNGKCFVYIENKLYNYMISKNSISRSNSLDKFLKYNLDAAEGLEACIRYLDAHLPQCSKYMIEVIIRFEMESLISLIKYRTTKKEYYMHMVKHIQKYKGSEYYTRYIKWYCKLIKIHPGLFQIAWKLKDIIRR